MVTEIGGGALSEWESMASLSLSSVRLWPLVKLRGNLRFTYSCELSECECVNSSCRREGGIPCEGAAQFERSVGKHILCLCIARCR